MKFIKEYFRKRRWGKAMAVLKEHGLSAVRIERIAGAAYLRGPNGTMYKIGRMK